MNNNMNVTLPLKINKTSLYHFNKTPGSPIKIDHNLSQNNVMSHIQKVLHSSKKPKLIIITCKNHLLNNLNNNRSVIMPLRKCTNSPLKAHNNHNMKDNLINSNPKESSS